MKNILSQERLEAHAGAALSVACIKLPKLVGRHYIGEPNADRHLAAAYPLEPLQWRVAKILGSAVHYLAEYPGDPDAGSRPKDFPTAAISSIEARHLRPHHGESILARPAVGWVYKDSQLLVSPIPETYLEDLENDTFQFAMRRGQGVTKVTAGLWLKEEQELWTRGEVLAGDIVPVSEIPEAVAGF